MLKLENRQRAIWFQNVRKNKLFHIIGITEPGTALLCLKNKAYPSYTGHYNSEMGRYQIPFSGIR